MNYVIKIELKSEKAANFLKKQIEENFPLIEGNINIIKGHEIKPLNEVIDDIKNEKRSLHL